MKLKETFCLIHFPGFSLRAASCRITWARTIEKRRHCCSADSVSSRTFQLSLVCSSAGHGACIYHPLDQLPVITSVHFRGQQCVLEDSVQIIHEEVSVTSKCLGSSRDNQRIFRVCSSSAWRQLPMKMLLRFLVILLPVLPPWSLNEGLGLRRPSIR